MEICVFKKKKAYEMDDCFVGAEKGIRDGHEARGLGNLYKRRV